MNYFDLGSGNSLKILERQHAPALFELVETNRAHLREWLPWVDDTREVGDVAKFIDGSREQHSSNKGFQAGIFCGDEIVGCIGFHDIDWDNGKVSIGYWLGEEFSGRGIMTSACRGLVNYAFKQYGLNRISILCAVANQKSRGIPERLGFKHEGTLRQSARLLSGEYADMAVYGLLASEWK